MLRFVPLACLLILLAVQRPAEAGSLRDEITAQLLGATEAAASSEEMDGLYTLEAFYREREFAPVWVTEDGASERGRHLAKLLSRADQDALDPADYGAQAILPLLAATRSDLLAELEVRLSLGLINFAADLGQGRTEPQVADPDLFVYRQDVDKTVVIRSAAATDDVDALVRSYRPQTPRYTRLKAALEEYRALAQAGGWEAIPGGETLKPGMTEPRVALLRERLRLWGDLKPADDVAETGGDADFYDPALEVAVKRMQYRHGLATDGAVGKNSLAALNVTAEQRVAQIALNLERRRWMPDDLGQRHLLVNLADFTLKVVDEPKTIIDMRVVIGKTYHATPIFSHTMRYVVINPYWHVPPSIAKNELLPKIQKDVGYLAKNNFTVLSDWSSSAVALDPESIDWSQYSRKNFPFKLRQGSGDGNALGRLKFMFPNHFNIYLHDTPAKALFAKAQRSFSHGCIRVQDPVALAEVVLSGTPGWAMDDIKATIDSEERTIVSLAEPLPVHITYLTSWVNKDGSVHFRNDIYKRDARLADALLGNRGVQL